MRPARIRPRWLTTGTATRVTPGGSGYQFPATGDGEFLVEEAGSPDGELATPGIGYTPNDDSLSSVVVLNSRGQVVQRIEHFNYFNFFAASIADLLRLNPATRTAYTLGLAGSSSCRSTTRSAHNPGLPSREC